MLSYMLLGIKVSSTKVTNDAKSYMNIPHMLTEVRGRFKVLFANVTPQNRFLYDNTSHASISSIRI